MTITDVPPAAPALIPHAGRHWSGADADSPWLQAAKTLAPILAERAVEVDRSGEFVHHGVELLRTNRLLSMLVPAELGGGGATFAETCAVLAELAHGCPSTSLTFSMHLHLVAAQVWRHHRGLPAPVLARVADEQVLLVSTGAADWLSSNGSARAVEGGYRVSARKTPASGCPAGDVMVTSFRLDGGPDGPQVLHCSVPFRADGVHIEETWDTMGMRATGSHTIVLDEVFVPEAAISLARPADRWHPVWSTVLGVALPLIMASYVGVAEAAAAEALQVAGARTTAAGPVAPLAGRMVNRLTSAQDTVAAMIAACEDLTFDNTLDAAMASMVRKTNAADAAIDTVRLAVELAGGAGYRRTGNVERLFRDVHGALFHPLPAAQQEHACGRFALGLDPFPVESGA